MINRVFLIRAILICLSSFSSSFASQEKLDESRHIPAVQTCEASSDYRCIFNKEGGPKPDPDDPYQSSPTTLSARFLERMQKENPSNQAFANTKHIITLGDYQVDLGTSLGSGDDGHVYLARHLSTRIFVAAKNVEMLTDEDQDMEYKS